MSKMNNVSPAVQRYLESEDAFARAQLLQANPNLETELQSADVRQAILTWLSVEDAWQRDTESLTENCIEFLTPKAAPGEAETIRQFSLHSNPHIRLRSYEFLVNLYFPDRNREALLVVLQAMLSDQSETIRREAAGYIERAGAGADLQPFLRRWQAQAAERGWTESESFELVARLLAP